MAAKDKVSVTVIIPAFNAQDVLDRAVSSVLDQTSDILEIIIIDDASSDDTLKLARSLSDKHSQIQVIALEHNGGPSKARNAGLSASRGEWIALLDADDAWKPDRIAALVKLGTELQADYIADNQILYDAAVGEEVRLGFRPQWASKVITAVELFDNDLNGVSEFGYALLKPLMRREFLQSHTISYNERYRFGEDFLFSAEILLNGGVAVLISDAYYIYTTRRGELSGEISPHSKTDPRFDLSIEASDQLVRKYSEKMSPALMSAVSRRRKQMQRIHLANVARGYRRSGRYIRYAFFVVTHPPLLKWLVTRLVGRVLPGAMPNLDRHAPSGS